VKEVLDVFLISTETGEENFNQENYHGRFLVHFEDGDSSSS